MRLLRVFGAWIAAPRRSPPVALDGRRGVRPVVIAAAVVVMQACLVAWVLAAAR